MPVWPYSPLLLLLLLLLLLHLHLLGREWLPCSPLPLLNVVPPIRLEPVHPG